ncbi:MAG: peptidylprolyl isomerase [Thermodesulfovibrionales bacterium]|nr:peptidylprolyl isomerase [Thermodesulfovibrionales bacterium]
MKKKASFCISLGVISVLMLCIFTHRVEASILLDRVVAVVNKEIITWSELYKMMESEAGDKIKTMDETERMKLFRENEPLFLEKLIDIRLQIQDAKKIGFEVGPAEVKEAIENIKNKYSMSDTELEEMLKKEGLSLEEYKKQLSEQILVRQYLSRQVRSKIVLSDEEVEHYLKVNRENIIDTEAYKLRQILFRKPKDEAGNKMLEEKIAALAEKLKTGEDFAAIARETSEDSSAKSGGDLGFVKKSLLAKEFLIVLESLKPGEISKPFWTGQGLHIIKLEEKTTAQSMDQVREAVRKKMEDEQFLARYKNLIKGLREKSHIEIRL